MPPIVNNQIPADVATGRSDRHRAYAPGTRVKLVQHMIEVPKRIDVRTAGCHGDQCFARAGEMFPSIRWSAPPEVASPGRQLRAIFLLSRFVHRGEILKSVGGFDNARVDLHLGLARPSETQSFELPNDATAVCEQPGRRVELEEVRRIGSAFGGTADTEEDMASLIRSGGTPDRVLAHECRRPQDGDDWRAARRWRLSASDGAEREDNTHHKLECQRHECVPQWQDLRVYRTRC